MSATTARLNDPSPDEAKAIEFKADIDSLEALQHQRRQMLPVYLKLKALHGPFGMWDHRRKAMLEALKIQAIMEAQKAGSKYTDKTIDAAAHASVAYEQFLDEGTASRIEFLRMDVEMDEIVERIRSREFELTAWSAETRLGR